METTIIVDVLRRGGIEVTLAGLAGPQPVTCSRGVRLVPDISLEAVTGQFDVIVLPGGAAGAQALADSAAVGQLLREQLAAGRMVGAICAAPIALLAHDIAAGAAVTSHPSVREQLGERYALSDERVVEAGQLVTSQGPGTTFEFALALLGRLVNPELAAKVAAPMML